MNQPEPAAGPAPEPTPAPEPERPPAPEPIPGAAPAPAHTAWTLGLAALSGSLLLCVVNNWIHRWSVQDLTALDLLGLYGVVLAQVFVLMSPLALLALAARRRRKLADVLVGGGWALMCAYFAIDLHLYRVSGNHLTAYARFLNDKAPAEWGGSATTLATPLLSLAGLGLALGLAGFLIARYLVDRLAARLPRTSIVVVAWTLACLGPSLLLAGARHPHVVVHFAEQSPVPLPLLGHASASDEFLSALNQDLSAAYEELRPALERAGPVDPATPTRTPHVFLIVLESFRGDSLDPRWLPKLSRWAEGGLTGASHYAGSNCSHFGLFGLLHGRHPLAYVSTLEAGQPAQLPESLRRAGYERHLYSSATVTWQRMNQYLSRRNFDHLVIDEKDTWPERDRRAIDYLRALSKRKTPQFALAFLVSTHFDYAYPAEYARYAPVPKGENRIFNPRFFEIAEQRTADSSMRARWLNRYRNTLAFMDDLLGDFVAELDPANTLVLVTGDHGESFYDDGTWLHSSRLSDIQSKVPLALVGAGVPPARRDAPSSHVDLAPTILSALGAGALEHTHGFDLLSQPERPSPILLVNQDLRELAVLTPRGRLQLSISSDRKRLTSRGFLDEFGRLMLSRPASASPRWWADATRDVLRRLSR